MASTFAAKLRLTAAALGCGSRKELCARFRAVNPATVFDLERSHKWLQGVAMPRSASVYEDWRRLLGTAQPAGWLAACSVVAFTDELCALFSADRAELEAGAEAFGRRGRAAGPPEAPPMAPRDHRLGTFLFYCWSLSPWSAGRLNRGVLWLEDGSRGRYRARYEELMRDGPFRLEGPVHVEGRLLFVELGADPSLGYGRFYLSLLTPGRPVDAMIGDVIGATLIGPDPMPATSPMVLLRVDEAGAAAARNATCHIPADQTALAADLATFGFGGLRAAQLAAMMLAFLGRSRQGPTHASAEALTAIVTALLAPRDVSPSTGEAEDFRALRAGRSA